MKRTAIPDSAKRRIDSRSRAASVSVSTAVGSSKMRPKRLLVDLARDLDELHVPDGEPRDREPFVDGEPDAVERAARVRAHGLAVQHLEAAPAEAREGWAWRARGSA